MDVEQEGCGEPEEEEEKEEQENNEGQSFQIVRPLQSNFFSLEVMSSRSFKNLNAINKITYKAKLKNPPGDELLNDLIPNLHGLFDTILDELRQNYSDDDLVRVYIDHPKLEKAIIIPPTYLGELNSSDILDHIDQVLYSAGEIPADEQLHINVACVKLLKGSGRKLLVNPEEDIKKKKAFIRIVNNDNTCLPRAIVVGMAKLKVDENPFDQYLIKQYDRVRNSRIKYQGEAATNNTDESSRYSRR